MTVKYPRRFLVDNTYTVGMTSYNLDCEYWRIDEEEDKEENEKKNRLQKMKNKKEAKERREKKEQKKRAQQKVQKEVKAQEDAQVFMKNLLFQFQEKLNIVRDNDPISRASGLVRTLTSLTDILFVNQCAEHAFEVLQLATKDYIAALEENISMLQANISLDPSELNKIPDYPELPPVFFSELQKAKDRKNLELDSECPICQENMTNCAAEGLFQCPTCRKHAHLDCLQLWWSKNNSCPCCRAKWK